jgi:hypothetical protein
MERRLALVGWTLVTLVGCERVPPDSLDIVVTDSGRPVAGIEIRSGEQLLGRSDSMGHLRLDNLKPFGTVLLLEARHPDPLSSLLPTARSVAIPWAFFPDDLKVELSMGHIPSSAGNASSAAVLPETPRDPSSNEAGEQTVGAEVAAPPKVLSESDLAPEPTRTPWPTPTMAPTVMATLQPPMADSSGAASPILLATPPAADSAAASPSPKEIVAHIFLSGKPLAGVQVFATDVGTHSVVPMGVTASDGVLRVPFPTGLKPEGLLMRHPCCKPQIRPIMTQGNSPNMTTLTNEKGSDFLLMRDLYGYARTMPNTELWSGGARIDVAGESGVAITSLAQVVKNQYSLVNRDAVPESFAGTFTPKENEGKPVIVYGGTKRPQLPVVGLIEFPASEENAGRSSEGRWRRFRREIYPRFVQNQTMRAMIPSDVLALGDAAKLKPRELVERGWEFTVMNPSLDFLLVLDGQQKGNFAARLVDRSGIALWEGKIAAEESVAPEKRGAELFAQFVERFPFEGSVLALADGVVTLNLSNDIDRGIKVGQKFEFYGPQKGEPGGRLVEHVGQGEVVEVGRGSVRVRVMSPKLELKPERWIGVRARRTIGGG